jgi:hypothetical protein
MRLWRSSLLSKNAGGLTLVEAMMATVICAIVSVFFFKMMVAGDKVRGRGRLIQRAATLAANQAEYVKSAIGCGVELTDTIYETTLDNRTFVVERSILTDESDSVPSYRENIQEIEVKVHLIETDTTLVRFRILQGTMP